jgi:serine/threonine protein kinase
MKIQVLGHGNFATVRVAYHEIANVKVAMKIVDTRVLDAENLAKIEREIKILQQLNHPFIVRLFEVIRTESYIYIVMQYVRNGELFDLLMECGKQTEEDSRQIFQQLIAAVAYLHNNGVFSYIMLEVKNDRSVKFYQKRT